MWLFCLFGHLFRFVFENYMWPLLGSTELATCYIRIPKGSRRNLKVREKSEENTGVRHVDETTVRHSEPDGVQEASQREQERSRGTGSPETESESRGIDLEDEGSKESRENEARR